MNYTFRLEQFEGPLDLLLKLIEDEKLDITTISLAKVTDQYLAFVDREEELPPDELADFLVVAAKLIYIKSKYLLPTLTPDEDDGPDLERQLRMYREYYLASKAITRMIGKKQWSYMRVQPLKIERPRGFFPPRHVTVADMRAVFEGVLGRIDRILKLPKIVLKTTVSIREKIAALKSRLEHGLIRFRDFYDRSNKQDVIVSFLALLELVKMRHITVDQSELFAEIIISKSSHHE